MVDVGKSLSEDDGPTGTIGVRLPATTVERLDELAARTGCTRSELVRDALNVVTNPAALVWHLTVRLLDGPS